MALDHNRVIDEVRLRLVACVTQNVPAMEKDSGDIRMSNTARTSIGGCVGRSDDRPVVKKAKAQ